MKSWKTTATGILGGFLALFGPIAQARLAGDKTAPPITTEQVVIAGALAVLGVFAKDHDVTGGPTSESKS